MVSVCTLTFNTTRIFFTDVEPWLNVSTGCTFPAPWANSSDLYELPAGTNTTNDTGIGEQRPITEYVGDYEHLAFGNFTVYVRDDSLRYKFGLLLRGSLNASETRDKFIMHIEYPFDYNIYSYPNYSNGFPVYFNESGRSDGTVDEVKVSFIELSVSPVVFKKGVESNGSQNTNGATRAYMASLPAMSLFVIITALVLL